MAVTEGVTKSCSIFAKPLHRVECLECWLNYHKSIKGGCSRKELLSRVLNSEVPVGKVPELYLESKRSKSHNRRKFGALQNGRK